MKEIKNWRNATVFDIEANGLEDATEIHVLSYEMQSGRVGSLPAETSERLKKFFSYHIDNEMPLVAHRGMWYDIPLVERLLGLDLSELMVIDTLMLSWYLNIDREQHGLGTFHEDYGIPKPKVQNHRWNKPVKEHWNTEVGHNLRLQRHFKMMSIRCQDDVKINKALWEDFKERLTDMYASAKYYIDKGDVDGKRVSEDEVCYIDQYKDSSSVDEYVNRILTFLMFKADTAVLREKTKFEVDVESLENLYKELDEDWSSSKTALEEVMPSVPKYTKKARPKKPFKKDGTPSTTGLRWSEAKDSLGKKDDKGNLLAEMVDKDTMKVLSSYDQPNANSAQQIKDWLYGFGWKPQTFEHVKDKAATQKWAEGGFRKSEKPEVRRVPQLSIKGDEGKELCPSVIALAEKVPEVMHYNKYTTVKHRLDMVKGFKENLTEGKYLKARVGGLTNCMVADSLVLTTGGMKRIVDVTKAHKVLTHEGRYRQVIDLINNGVKDVVRISFESGKEITCTLNHKVYTTEKEWVMASDLFIGQGVMSYGSKEEWLPVEGFEGCHVSSWGRVSSPSGSIYTLNIRKGKDTRSSVTLPTGRGRGKTFLVSRLVAKAFLGESSLHVLHKDGNPNNNNLQNLYYGTDEDNWADTKKHATHLTAVRAKVNGKLTQAQIEEIREASGKGVTYKELSEVYGISHSYVSMIITGRRRKYAAENTYTEQFGVDRVTRVEPLGRVPTYDISVEEDHSYIANGIVVHNTLRDKHRELVNLPGVHSPYGEQIRGSLIAGKGKVLLGSDLSSLEDRVKHSFMIPHDKAYVDTMLEDDFDPHILMALTAGLITEEEFNNFKAGKPSDNAKLMRKAGKTANYACVYGSGAETLARGAGMSIGTAKKLIEAYWELNWSVKAIAEDQCVFTCSKGKKWLINPVNGFCYSIRKDADKFSTLCQGTGSFFFDMWVDKVLDGMYNKFGVRRLSASFHDEYVACFKDTEANREFMENLTRESIKSVSEDYFLRRELGCDVQFGDNYSEIH